MAEEAFAPGTIVTAIYKTGKYIGEVTGESPASYLVRVLAVINHPMQGDLHNPKQTEDVVFHQRRALAFREQANVPRNMVRLFEGDIPEYKSSLKEALKKQKEKLAAGGREWDSRSMEMLEGLEADYFK